MTAGPEGRGVLLPDARLALDCAVEGYTTVIGHAHGDHVPPPPFVADATEATCALVEARFSARREAGEDVPRCAWRLRAMGEPFRAGEATVTFHPSGHVLGGALVEARTRAGAVLYTGDFKDRPPASCAPLDVSGLGPVDVLVTESTFGLPLFKLLDTVEGEARLAAFCAGAFAEEATPILLAWSLGKAQEAATLLDRRGIPVVLHGGAWRMAEVYAAHGRPLPLARAYDGKPRPGEALIVPPDSRAAPMVTKIAERRLGLVSGWARLDAMRVQMDCDELLPLSDHADFPGLLAFAQRIAAPRVVANHGYAEAFSHVLRRAGFAAEALAGGEEERPT